MKGYHIKNNRLFYFQAFGIYIAVICILFFLFARSNSAMQEKNNMEQLNMVVSLLADNTNDAISYMSGYVKELSVLLSKRDLTDMEKIYEEISADIDSLPGDSMGLVDMKDIIYGREGDILDIRKYGFLEEMHQNEEELFITEPYRSCISGSNVITMFMPLFHEGTKAGSVFVTYSLEEIRDIATSEVLPDRTEIFLMNAYSGNYIACTATETAPAGTWNNSRMFRQTIKPMKGYDYKEWEASMQKGMNHASVFYTKGDVSYIEAYQKINSMKNWFITVRVPIVAISSTFVEYQGISTIYGGLWIVLTVLIFLLLLYNEIRRNHRLQELSSTDTLTGTMNRRAFEERIERLMNHHDKPEVQGVLMFLDVDYFKSYNDTYGHSVGDQILQYFAAMLKRVFTTDSVISRIGGDEFIIFVPENLSREEMEKKMQQLKDLLKDISVESDRTDSLSLTFSSGLARYPQDADNVEQLLNKADAALYKAKENGRNQYFWY